MYHVKLSKLARILAPQGATIPELCEVLRSYRYNYPEDPDCLIEENAVRCVGHKYGVTIPVDVYKNDWFGYRTILRRIGPDAFDKYPWLIQLEDCENYEQCSKVINSVFDGVFEMSDKGNIAQHQLAPYDVQYLLAALFSDKSHGFLFKLGPEAFDEELLETYPKYKYDMRIDWDESTGILKAGIQYRTRNVIVDNETRKITRETGCLHFRQMIDWGTESLISEHYNTPEIYASGSFDEDGNLIGVISAD